MSTPKIEETSFFVVHKLLQSRPTDRALRVDREHLEGMMVEIISAAKRAEMMQQAIDAISPAMDFTSDESPQDTIMSLLRECRAALCTAQGDTEAQRARREALVTRIDDTMPRTAKTA